MQCVLLRFGRTFGPNLKKSPSIFYNFFTKKIKMKINHPKFLFSINTFLIKTYEKRQTKINTYFQQFFNHKKLPQEQNLIKKSTQNIFKQFFYQIDLHQKFSCEYKKNYEYKKVYLSFFLFFCQQYTIVPGVIELVK